MSYTVKEGTAVETTTMSNSRYVKELAKEFLSTVETKNSWGKNQIMGLFHSLIPEGTEPKTLPHLIEREFRRKISENNSWGKNQIELIFVKAVANATLIMLDK